MPWDFKRLGYEEYLKERNQRRWLAMKNIWKLMFVFACVFILAGCGEKEIYDKEDVEDRIAETEESEIIVYNGKEYKKSELCNATLQWLKLSEEERLFSSYMPPEFMEFVDTWGITLTLEDASAEGGVIKCTQSGGEPTGELQTGSWYIVEAWTKEKGWSEVPYVIDGEIGWTSEAWMIPKENTCEWEVDWKWLYGALPSGKYRIGKTIMEFRGPGDFDNVIYFAEFMIE
jgi:hypothetical protein